MQNNIASEINYPIQKQWTQKLILNFVITLLGYSPFFAIGVFIIVRISQNGQLKQEIFSSGSVWAVFAIVFVFLGIRFVHFYILYLQKNNFHFSLTDEFITVRQGVFSKQERNVPYSTIQSAYVQQGYFDRLFHIFTLIIENVSGSMLAVRSDIGLSGNQIIFPGLKKEDAENLKNLILAKMKENPSKDQSGL